MEKYTEQYWLDLQKRDYESWRVQSGGILRGLFPRTSWTRVKPLEGWNGAISAAHHSRATSGNSTGSSSTPQVSSPNSSETISGPGASSVSASASTSTKCSTLKSSESGQLPPSHFSVLEDDVFVSPPTSTQSENRINLIKFATIQEIEPEAQISEEIHGNVLCEKTAAVQLETVEVSNPFQVSPVVRERLTTLVYQQKFPAPPSVGDVTTYFRPEVQPQVLVQCSFPEIHQLESLEKQIQDLKKMSARYQTVQPYLQQIAELDFQDHFKPDPELDAEIEESCGWDINLEFQKVQEEMDALNKILKNGIAPKSKSQSSSQSSTSESRRSSNLEKEQLDLETEECYGWNVDTELARVQHEIEEIGKILNLPYECPSQSDAEVEDCCGWDLDREFQRVQEETDAISKILKKEIVSLSKSQSSSLSSTSESRRSSDLEEEHLDLEIEECYEWNVDTELARVQHEIEGISKILNLPIECPSQSDTEIDDCCGWNMDREFQRVQEETDAISKILKKRFVPKSKSQSSSLSSTWESSRNSDSLSVGSRRSSNGSSSNSMLPRSHCYLHSSDSRTGGCLRASSRHWNLAGGSPSCPAWCNHEYAQNQGNTPNHFAAQPRSLSSEGSSCDDHEGSGYSSSSYLASPCHQTSQDLCSCQVSNGLASKWTQTTESMFHHSAYEL